MKTNNNFSLLKEDISLFKEEALLYIKKHKTQNSLREAAVRRLNKISSEKPSIVLYLLVNEIPTGGKYRVTRKVVRLFVKKRVKENQLEVKNYLLLRCIVPTIRTESRLLTRRKLSEKDYLSKKNTYDIQIKNRLRTINKYLKPINVFIKFYSYYSKLIKLKRT